MLRRSNKSKKSREGSAQIIEMSFVLPSALLVVAGLIYLSFGMFMYVHSYNLSALAADKLSDELEAVSIYWRINGVDISDEKSGDSTAQIKSQLKDLSLLPGITFSYEPNVGMKWGEPWAYAEITCFYFDKKLYSVKSEKTAFKPCEFVNDTDFAADLFGELGLSEISAEKLEKLREMYNEIF